MAAVERLWGPLGLFVLLVSVIVTGGSSTTPSSITTTADLVATPTPTPATSSEATPAPIVTMAAATSSSNESSSSDSTTSTAANTTLGGITDTAGNLVTPSSGSTTISPQNVSDANATITPIPPRPDESITNTKLDPVVGLTTPTLTSSPTPVTTTQAAGQSLPVTQTPVSVNGDNNPYDNIPVSRPRPQGPLTPQQQQQRLLYPWLFMGSDYLPYYLLQSSLQNSQQGSTANTAANNFAPLYMTAMDKEMWPLLFTQQRSQQQQIQQRRGPPNQNTVTTRQDQRTPPHIQNRNNLANTWFFLNEF